jgi:hypothetical protein
MAKASITKEDVIEFVSNMSVLELRTGSHDGGRSC